MTDTQTIFKQLDNRRRIAYLRRTICELAFDATTEEALKKEIAETLAWIGFTDSEIEVTLFNDERLDVTIKTKMFDIKAETSMSAIPGQIHPTHSVRFSDASTCDMVCELCGAHDEVPGGFGDLVNPCPGPADQKEQR